MNERQTFPMSQEAGFWTPKVIPRTSYTIDCQIDPSAGRLQGHETIEIENQAEKPISRLALNWSLGGDQSVEITAQGEPVRISPEAEGGTATDPLVIDLPEPLLPGKIQVLEVDFSKRLTIHRGQTQHTLTGWHPRLWWGFATHSAFSVRVEAPSGYAVGTSGYLDPESGYNRQEGVRSFGIFLGKDHRVMEREVGDVRIRCVHTDRGADCARMILSTAVDVVRFYSDRFGFYPYRSLTIVPGMAVFADGTRQTRFTDRLLDTHILSFESSAPLEEVKLDPDGALALVVPPPPATGKELNERLRELPWTGVDEKARDLFRKAREADLEDADFWGVLGLKAYDGGFYPEALEAFRRAVDLAAKGNIWEFVATVWQGHLLDLLGQRNEAVQCYEKARELDAGETMEHGQYDILIDTRWVLEHLKTPFERS